jgi:hypothetical protein
MAMSGSGSCATPSAATTRTAYVCDTFGGMGDLSFGTITVDVQCRRMAGERGTDVIVTFPDGTTVQATGRGRPEGDPSPDFALYLDGCWQDEEVPWEQEFIDWPDFGLPDNPVAADAAIRNTFEKARQGRLVEVGCLGGTGRTGTVLACMAILAGVPAGAAKRWVREHYRAGAVETPEQQAFVLEFGSRDVAE